MDGPAYIQVILPLRLEWDPCYRLPEGMRAEVGSRVRVLFAHKEYVGTVSAVDVTPDISEDRILPILSMEDGLPQILPEEIRFWKMISDYYLCSIGEVYKAIYLSMKLEIKDAEIKEKMNLRLQKRITTLQDKVAKAKTEEKRKYFLHEIQELTDLPNRILFIHRQLET